MQRLCGFRENGYCFEVQVPTTIFDPQRLQLTAYEENKDKRGAEISSIYVSLQEMPKWNISCQCILLSKADEARLEADTKKFVASLPNRLVD